MSPIIIDTKKCRSSRAAKFFSSEKKESKIIGFKFGYFFYRVNEENDHRNLSISTTRWVSILSSEINNLFSFNLQQQSTPKLLLALSIFLAYLNHSKWPEKKKKFKHSRLAFHFGSYRHFEFETKRNEKNGDRCKASRFLFCSIVFGMSCFSCPCPG